MNNLNRTYRTAIRIRPLAFKICLLTSFCMLSPRRHLLGGDNAPAKPDTGDAESVTQQFNRLYRLEPGRVLRVVPRPFHPCRLAYYALTQRQQAEAIPDGPDTMYVKYVDGQPKIWSMTFGGEVRSITLLARFLLGLREQQLQGRPDLLQQGLIGDLVYDPQASPEALLVALQGELQANGVQVAMSFKDVVRDTYVCRGEYKLTPLPDSRNKSIEVFGLALDADNSGYGGGSGDLNELLADVGEWINMPIVNAVETPPRELLNWHFNLDGKFAELEQKMARDPELVTTNLTVQTGLTFTLERRPVRTLVITPLEQPR